MANVVHVASDENLTSYHDAKIAFKQDVAQGLSLAQKQIPSKYFYDEIGSDLFNQITRHPDYYLTRIETHILQTHQLQIAKLMTGKTFNLVELGPGEGIKTQHLMQTFLEEKLQFTYLPIDISTPYLKYLRKQFLKAMPNLSMTPIHSDYFNGLGWLSAHTNDPNLVLFLGSSIGNFTEEETHVFLSHLAENLNADDYLLIGFDLRKDLNTLFKAYNDDAGLTQQFNLNILSRMNNELGATFNLQKFHHYPTYNVQRAAMESYLLSAEKQDVYIESLQTYYHFEISDAIHLEYSHKYHLQQIQHFAKQNGFQVIQHFMDDEQNFVDSLWQVKK